MRLTRPGARKTLLFITTAAFSGSQPEKDHGEPNQDDSPDKVDVDSERSLVNGFVADESEARQQHAEDSEHESDWNPYIEPHHAAFNKRRCSGARSRQERNTPALR